jgi:hypothetical protein
LWLSLEERMSIEAVTDMNYKPQLPDVPFVQNVATISAGNDRVIGDMIAEALDKVGLQCLGCCSRACT